MMRTLLMVDDDILFLQALNKHLDFVRLGYDQALTATSADQALHILQTQPVDVLLCDIEMPGKDGLEIARWIVSNQYHAVVLLLTCHSNFAYAKEAINLDVFDYLLKPIRMEVLEERLVQALHKRNEINWLAAYKKEISQLPPPSESDTVMRIREYIEDHIATELTREQLGHVLFMNPDYIARLFREKQGISLNDYIRNRRISHAKRLLRETDLPLTEVCERVGYAYNTYFFNVFKKATGLSPNEYRNEFRNG